MTRRLGRISERDDRHLRMLLTHGVRVEGKMCWDFAPSNRAHLAETTNWPRALPGD